MDKEKFSSDMKVLVQPEEESSKRLVVSRGAQPPASFLNVLDKAVDK